MVKCIATELRKAQGSFVKTQVIFYDSAVRPLAIALPHFFSCTFQYLKSEEGQLIARGSPLQRGTKERIWSWKKKGVEDGTGRWGSLNSGLFPFS